MIRGVGLVFAQATITGAALAAHDALVCQFDARAGRAVGIEEFYLQKTRVVLLGLEVETYLQFLGGRNFSFHAGIVEGIAVGKRQPAIVQRDGGVDGGMDVPSGEVGKCCGPDGKTIGNRKLRAVSVAMRFCLYGYGDMCHPHVFLVHRIGHPKV